MDSNSDLRKLTQSGQIKLPKGANPDHPQEAILLVLHEQNVNQERQNLHQSKLMQKYLKKLDSAADASRAAADAAKAAVLKAEIAAKTGEDVKQEFVKLNGKVSKTIERVATLEDIENRKKEDDIKKDLIKKGMMIIPQKISSYIRFLGKFCQAALAIFGCLTILYPLIKWFFHP